MRPTIDEYFILIALAAASRASCLRRKVGCVIVDKNNFVLSTGYNGPPKGVEHCISSPCLGAKAQSGTGLNLCIALHAEVNAINHCANIDNAATIYCTTKPCVACAQVICRTKIERIVYLNDYPHTETESLCKDYNVKLERFDMNERVTEIANILQGVK